LALLRQLERYAPFAIQLDAEFAINCIQIRLFLLILQRDVM
jgi:hypothetical protein